MNDEKTMSTPEGYKDSGVEWIGTIPEDWDCLKGKYVFNERSSKGNKINCELLSPTQKYGVIPQHQLDAVVKVKEGTDLSTFKTIHKGDFCISLRSFQGGIEYCAYEGVVSPAYHVLYPNRHIFDGYFRYLLKSVGFIAKIASYSDSLRDGKNISYQDFGKTELPVPPLDEQERIAGYLDERVRDGVDPLVRDLLSQKEELIAYKKTVIHNAVTKGLNQNAPLKDSGAPAVGAIPAHWEYTKMPYRFEIMGSGGTPTSGVTEYYDNGTIPWLQVRDLGKSKYVQAETKITPKAMNETSAVRIYKAPFVAVAMYASIGSVSICEEDSSTNQAICAIGAGEQDLTYLYYLMSGLQEKFISDGAGSTQKNISQSYLSSIRVPVPPLDEQRVIACYLDEKCKMIDEAVTLIDEQVADMNKYRQSLVYAATTGKIRV